MPTSFIGQAPKRYLHQTSNIIADYQYYTNNAQTLTMSADRYSEVLYEITINIEEICHTSYILPETIPRIMTVVTDLRKALRRRNKTH